MKFGIVDTFTNNLARLTGDEQKVVKPTAFDLLVKSANPRRPWRQEEGHNYAVERTVAARSPAEAVHGAR